MTKPEQPDTITLRRDAVLELAEKLALDLRIVVLRGRFTQSIANRISAAIIAAAVEVPCAPCGHDEEDHENVAAVSCPCCNTGAYQVIHHRNGKPSLALTTDGKGGVVTREFWLVQLHDGRYFRQWVDSEERGAPSLFLRDRDDADAVVAGMLQQGTHVEVRA